MRKIPFVQDEYYHIYNRGVDKRSIFEDVFDLARFYQSMQELNSVEPIGSIFAHGFNKSQLLRNSIPKSGESDKLVEFVAYCLNFNHFHFILRPVAENGISEFMRRLSIGHTNYFNIKYKRSGVLFQGTFKAIHINSDSYLRHLSVYVNLNNRIHAYSQSLRNSIPKSKFELTKSSWEEYSRAKIVKGKNGDNQFAGNPNDFCVKDMILSHFDTVAEYKNFSEETLQDIKKNRYDIDENFNYEKFLLEKI